MRNIMSGQFSWNVLAIKNESVLADYSFTLFPSNHPPINKFARIETTVPDEGCVSREEIIYAMLWQTATSTLEAFEQSLPVYVL